MRQKQRMKYFELRFSDGTYETVQSESALKLIQDRDLASRDHVDTRIVELTGEKEAIARDWFEN